MPCFDCIYLNRDKKFYNSNKTWFKFGCGQHGQIGMYIQEKPSDCNDSPKSIDSQLKLMECSLFESKEPEQLNLLINL